MGRQGCAVGLTSHGIVWRLERPDAPGQSRALTNRNSLAMRRGSCRPKGMILEHSPAFSHLCRLIYAGDNL